MKTLLIIAPCDLADATETARFNSIIHELSKSFVVTLITNQAKSHIEKSFSEFHSLDGIHVHNIHTIFLKRKFNGFLPFKVENILNYWWKRKNLDLPVDHLFLRYYQLLITLLKRYSYDLILLHGYSSLHAIPLIRKSDKKVPIVYQMEESRHNLFFETTNKRPTKYFSRVDGAFLPDYKQASIRSSRGQLPRLLASSIEPDSIRIALLEFVQSPGKCEAAGRANIHFVSFGSAKFKEALTRIKGEALSSGFFDTVTVFNEGDLPEDYLSEHADILNSSTRGFGYWIWKSYITKIKLGEINNGDILVYADAGCTINNEGKKRFTEYIEMIVNSKFSNLSFQMLHLEKQYTKGDLFKHFGVEQNSKIKNSGQLIGGIFFIRKDEAAIRLVNEWYSICHNHKNLIDDSPSYYPNDRQFIDHRHDQSVFSLLRKIHGSLIINQEVYFSDWDATKQFPIHARKLV